MASSGRRDWSAVCLATIPDATAIFLTGREPEGGAVAVGKSKLKSHDGFGFDVGGREHE
jgi:hypothetical protein